jgi:hypothetical protein
LKLRIIVALIWGALMGSITFALGPLSVISDNIIIGALQIVLVYLLVPGIIGAAAFSGNVHAFYLGVGAVINALFHFGLCWLLFALYMKLKIRLKV